MIRLRLPSGWMPQTYLGSFFLNDHKHASSCHSYITRYFVSVSGKDELRAYGSTGAPIVTSSCNRGFRTVLDLRERPTKKPHQTR